MLVEYLTCMGTDYPAYRGLCVPHQDSMIVIAVLRDTCTVPLSEGQNVQLLEQIVADQRQLLMDVFNTTDVTTIPQVWTLCKYRTHIPAHSCMVLVANVPPRRQRGGRLLRGWHAGTR